MEQKYFPNLTISDVRKPYRGVNGILTHSHIIRDAYLCLGRCYIRRIPCACVEYSNFMDLP